eukprot:12167409-Alexandrium_andersonii.AAC.1
MELRPAFVTALGAAAPARADSRTDVALSGPRLSQLNPSNYGAHEARPSSQCRFTNRKWRSIKSAFAAF